MTAPQTLLPIVEGSGTAGPLLDPKKNTAAAIWALFAGIGLLMLGNGLQGSAVGIRAQTEEFSTKTTGAVMAAYFIGFLVGSQIVTKALMKVGHIRVFAALGSMASTAVLLYSMAVDPIAWILMRFVVGFCMAGLFVVAESWINEARRDVRGCHLGHSDRVGHVDPRAGLAQRLDRASSDPRRKREVGHGE